MSEEELRKYFGIYTDCWMLFKKYCSAENTDAYWEAVDKESQQIAEKYGRTQFVNKMILHTLFGLKELCKNK